jgi:hypothetical protein
VRFVFGKTSNKKLRDSQTGQLLPKGHILKKYCINKVRVEFKLLNGLLKIRLFKSGKDRKTYPWKLIIDIRSYYYTVGKGQM